MNILLQLNYRWIYETYKRDVFDFLQEPTDSLEETLLLSQPDFSIETENGSEEGDNPSGLHSDNPINHSPDNARMYYFCTQCCICTVAYTVHVSAKL